MITKVFTNQQINLLEDCLMSRIHQWSRPLPNDDDEGVKLTKLHRINELKSLLDYINDGKEK